MVNARVADEPARCTCSGSEREDPKSIGRTYAAGAMTAAHTPPAHYMSPAFCLSRIGTVRASHYSEKDQPLPATCALSAASSISNSSVFSIMAVTILFFPLWRRP